MSSGRTSSPHAQTASVPRIAACKKASREMWEQCAGNPAGSATFFHTPLWAGIFTAASGGRMAPDPELLEFDDGATVLVPRVRRTLFGGALSLLWSMPAYTYGGWIVPAGSRFTHAHAGAVVAHLGTMRDLIWRENPYDPLCAELNIPGSMDDSTQTIDLDGGYTAAEARFDYAHRKAVKKARVSGMTITEAGGYREWEEYIALYGATRQRWKNKSQLRNRGFDAAVFKAIFDAPEFTRKLWLARASDGALAAGIICFYWNNHAVAWNGAGAEPYFKYRPNNLLYEHAIRSAAESGFRWFDCNPSGGLDGVKDFKTRLGAVHRRSRVVENRSPLRSAAEWVRRAFREK